MLRSPRVDRQQEVVTSAIAPVAAGASARTRLVARVKARLVAKGLPRLQMSLIVVATGASGFLVSWALLHLGVRPLWPRYFAAVVGAYGVFLLLVRAWLAFHRRRAGAATPGRGFDLDGVQVGGGWGASPGSGGSSGAAGSVSAGGGRFGGGGASEVFDAPGGGAEPAVASAASSSPGRSGFDVSFDLDGDEIVFIAAVVAVVAAVFVASAYVVVTAPAFFAEVLVDGSLSAGLYRRVRTMDGATWLETAWKRTWIPFAVVLVTVIAAGVVFHRIAPEAASIGDVARRVFASP